MSGRYVALLRGINLGGKNKLPMKDLVPIFESAACKNVQTYIQSGNVVFEANQTLARRLPTLITKAIQERLNIQIPVLLRSADEMKRIHHNNPFLANGADPTHLHVAFLADTPKKSEIIALDPDRSPPDQFVVHGSEIYLHCPNGLARTKLTNAYLDRKLATTCTIRNWKTVSKLIELAGQD